MLWAGMGHAVLWQASASHLVSAEAKIARLQAEHDATLQAALSEHNATVMELRAALDEKHAVLCQDFGVAPLPGIRHLA